MNGNYRIDGWRIIEEGFHPGLARESESIFSIGNGYMGQRANFEERYSGDSLQGTYVAGVYYPDKTRVGWWKNGYPEYFAKVLNAPRWIGIDIIIDGIPVDLSVINPLSFKRILDMKEGCLERDFIVPLPGGKSVELSFRRFVSMSEPDAGIIKLKVYSTDFEGNISFNIYLDADIRNEDANYGKKFWKEVNRKVTEGSGILIASTMKTGFHVATGMTYKFFRNGKQEKVNPEIVNRRKYVANTFTEKINPEDELILEKYVSVLSSLNNQKSTLMDDTIRRIGELSSRGYEKLISDHRQVWESIWEASDVVIEGDTASQQAIRFNIFQLNQTYTGRDERLNIGPKGFTGEKYGGSTYWDTEAFALPFFLKTADKQVAKNLLLYRYKQLDKAIRNAGKLGFKNGAALYPMVTMNGEECHNEWEITFEEIHRNGAIAFAIFNYIRYTGDYSYMADYGLEVLIGISRFWSQRVTWSEPAKKYMILGVTGPNEYENNVNNNWYTNTIAVWTLAYTISNLEKVRKEEPIKFRAIVKKTNFEPEKETAQWQKIINNMHFPYDEERKVFLQQDGFLDKELINASEIPVTERPINQHWSWDRILRSCFIKQADVIHGMYVFENRFDTDTLKRNFDFYEPMTVHESSLSACIHSIMASRTGNVSKAYELYLRTSRLDLDDYNHEVGEGLHITSMAGTWLAVVEGFGGMRVDDNKVMINPLIPGQWISYSFHARYRGVLFLVRVTKDEILIRNLSDKTLKISLSGNDFTISGGEQKSIQYKN